ncbi:MAG: hypothetical protein ACK5P7_12535 [Bdellovibrio sp.]|jgi:hypothetical protein
MSWTRSALTVAALFLFLAGCASSAQKQRKEQRDKLVQSAKLYCEFLNGEQYPDIDVALNVQMAQRCDSDKTFSITSYKTPSEIPGVMFCCATAHKNAPASVREKPVERVAPAKTAPAVEPKVEKTDNAGELE